MNVITPYDSGKNLGKAYNLAASNVPDNEWICFIDHDVTFLTPNAISILEVYAELFPEYGLLTCYTNRIHPLAKDQLLGGKVSEDCDIRNHIEIAKQQTEQIYQVTELNHEVSGFLMMFNKKTWEQVKFRENGQCLGIDNYFCWDLMSKGFKIGRMDGLYVWHTYRINDIKDKTHLNAYTVYSNNR